MKYFWKKYGNDTHELLARLFRAHLNNEIQFKKLKLKLSSRRDGIRELFELFDEDGSRNVILKEFVHKFLDADKTLNQVGIMCFFARFDRKNFKYFDFNDF